MKENPAYWIAVNGEVTGPVSYDALCHLWTTGKLPVTAQVMRRVDEQDGDWMPITAVMDQLESAGATNWVAYACAMVSVVTCMSCAILLHSYDRMDITATVTEKFEFYLLCHICVVVLSGAVWIGSMQMKPEA
jgi:hypothetical protein